MLVDVVMNGIDDLFYFQPLLFQDVLDHAVARVEHIAAVYGMQQVWPVLVPGVCL